MKAPQRSVRKAKKQHQNMVLYWWEGVFLHAGTLGFLYGLWTGLLAEHGPFLIFGILVCGILTALAYWSFFRAGLYFGLNALFLGIVASFVGWLFSFWFV